MKVESRVLRVESRKPNARRFSSPQPLTPSSWPRRGLSLTEVLIAMGILTLGLLGVASIFPVGSFYMQKAEIADRGSAIAQSVMSDLMARGMLNPRSWYVLVPPTVPSGVPAATFPSDKVRNSFTRSLGAALSEAIATEPAAATD